MNDELKNGVNYLLKIEGLDDLSIFSRSHESYEEIPLFSRYSHISFLSKLCFNEKNKFLIKVGLDLIEKIKNNIDKYKDEGGGFVCLSIKDWDAEDYEEVNCLTPSIFLSDSKVWVWETFSFLERNTIEENIVKEYIFSFGNADNVYVSKGFDTLKTVFIIS